ncbi:MAG: glycosyltransferase family 2 protein [Victivallales bacterium]|nr:glycosyltransferase family 2 protein [Victivallales bacterium]MCF7888638.1 glycosyltransferase family 2 protein [Victivallales bacterium]
MLFINNFINYVSSKTFIELFFLLWYFFIFDFTRYFLSDIFLCCYFIFFGKKFRERERIALKKLNTFKPLVSIIVPGMNEGKHLDELSDSLKFQSYKNFETIVVDDGSDDNTNNIGRRLEAENKITLFLKNKTRGGKASAANFGLRYAKGQFIVHMDADTSLRYDAIEKVIMPFFFDMNIGAVAGDVRVRNVNASIATNMQAYEYIKNISLGRAVNSRLNILRIVSGAFGAFKTEYLQRIGGWDIGPGLDGDITVKIRKLKKRIWFENAAVSYTNTPDTFKKLANQRYRWSRSLIRFRLRKHLNVFNIFSKDFNIFNFLSFTENVFFNVGLNFKWWFYIFFLLLFAYHDVKYLILLNYLLYVLLNTVQFIVCLFFLRKTLLLNEKLLIFYLPLAPLYTGIYLRIVRTYAYISEALFKMSYKDKWNPWKVSEKAEKEKF